MYAPSICTDVELQRIDVVFPSDFVLQTVIGRWCYLLSRTIGPKTLTAAADFPMATPNGSIFVESNHFKTSGADQTE